MGNAGEIELTTNPLVATFVSMWDALVDRLPYLLAGLIVLVLFLLIGRIARKTILAAGHRTRLDAVLAELLGRLVAAALGALGIFIAAVVIFPTFRPGDLIAGLGITSVAIGFAFKDILQNFFAGILILWRRPFIVGDQIRYKEYEGTVEEINMRSTRLLTYDGERAVIPNGEIYTNPLLVRTAYPLRRIRFSVGIGYPHSIERARDTILRNVAATDGVARDPGPWVYVSELAPSSVNFTVYFWTDSHQANVLKVSDTVASTIKRSLDEAHIEMPYPHTVVLFHDVTGTREGGVARGAGKPENPGR